MPAMIGSPETTTILFTDLVDSTTFLESAGDDSGQNTLRALVDFDEAWMHIRWPKAGSPAKARPLLETARAQFEAIGMTGWLRRADEMLATLPSNAS
jgi:hypothetical protein